MTWEIGFFVISVAVLLLILFAIPTLLQIRKTARNAEITLEAINKELPVILQDVRQITTLTNEVSRSVRFHVEERISRTARFNLKLLEGLSKQVGGTLRRLHDGIDRLSTGFDSLQGGYAGIEGRIERELRKKIVTGLKTFVLLIGTVRSALETARPRE
jgi:Bacterial protein of unknown function (DUF948)